MARKASDKPWLHGANGWWCATVGGKQVYPANNPKAACCKLRILLTRRCQEGSFERDWRVIQLGSDVPIRDLFQAVGFYQADLLGLSVSLRTQLATLKQTIEAVRRSESGRVVKILVGGRALAGASDLAAEFGADAYAADPSQAVALGNALVGLGSEAATGEDASRGPANAEG